MSDMNTKVQAIAARALLLSPGEAFNVGVTARHDPDEVCDLIVEELHRQHDAAVAMLGKDVAEPEEIGIGIGHDARGAFLMIDRADATSND